MGLRRRRTPRLARRVVGVQCDVRDVKRAMLLRPPRFRFISNTAFQTPLAGGRGPRYSELRLEIELDALLWLVPSYADNVRRGSSVRLGTGDI